MASNDMNSWDEDPDELLRQRWQRTFADFEVQPRASVRRRILDSLPKKRQQKPARWLAGLALLLLLGSALVYQIRSGNAVQSQPGTNTATGLSTSHQPTLIHPVHPSGTSGTGSRPTAEANNSASAPGTAHLPSVSTNDPAPALTGDQPATVGADRSGLPTILSHPLATAGAALPFGTRKPLRSTHRETNNRYGPQAGRPDKFTNNPSLPIKAERVAGRSAVAPVISLSDDNTSPPIAGLPLDKGSETGHVLPGQPALLKPHEGIYPADVLGTLLAHRSVLSPANPQLTQTLRRQPPYHWFVDVVPMSNFQWMRAIPTTMLHLAQVDAPAAFSAATWGYQVNGGIQFRHWQAQLSIGQLRRWAYYTVSENRYRVEPTASNPNQLVRETYAVSENKLLPMIGAGLSQYKQLSRGRYVLNLGAQVSYLPTTGQTLAGVQGGMGRQWQLSQQTAGQVGLTIDYGLTPLLSEQQQLAIHPLVVGLRFRIQPRFMEQGRD